MPPHTHEEAETESAHSTADPPPPGGRKSAVKQNKERR